MFKIKVIFIFLLPLILLNVKGQSPKIKGDFIHKSTNLKFPQKIDRYERSSIDVFDKKDLNIRAFYSSTENNGKTNFIVSVYPAGRATEDRLRNEFDKLIKSWTSRININIKSHPISYINSGFKINGIKSNIQSPNLISSLLVFECGSSFFKLVINGNRHDSLEVSNLEEMILDWFVPTKLVQVAPLKLQADIYFSDAAFADSMMLGCAMGSAYKKLEWALDNVDSLENISGFPGLYLELQIASLREFSNFEKTHPNFYKTQETADYLTALNSIINNGFLEEFIMEHYNSLLIFAKDYQFDFEAYNQWKETNPISIDLNKKYYSIEFMK